MSGDVTEQALSRLSHLPDNPDNPAELIAGQNYADVDFIGGSIANVVLTNVTINGVETAPTLRIVTTAPITIASDDYTLVIILGSPAAVSLNLSQAATLNRRLEIKDGAGNAATYPITLTGQVDGETNPAISTDYGSRIIEYNGTQWNVIASADSSEGIQGPATATDNAVVRFNGASGSIAQNSGVLIDDSNNVSGIGTLASGAITASSTVQGTRIISTIATGTAPLTVASTTRVSNLNAATSGNADTVTTNANLTGDVTSSGNATTIATVNSNVGSFTNASVTVNAKGQVTAASNGSAPVTSVSGTSNRITSTGGATPVIDISASYVGQASITTVGTLSAGAVPLSLVTGLGTGIATALAINTGSAGAPVLFNGAGGTPSSMTATNLSGTAASLTAGTVTTNANLTGDVTSSGNATTLATVNSNVGSFTNGSFTVNSKGLITAASSGTAPVTSVTGTTNRITSSGGATPVIDISASYVGQSSITTVGTLTGGATGTGFTVALGTSTITGTLGPTNGGTGQSTFTQGDIIYSSAANTLAKLGAGTAGQVLQTGGAAANPSWVDGTGISENRIFNAEMEIDQANEGASVSISNSNVVAQTIDGWAAESSNAATSMTMQRTATSPPAGFFNSLIYTIGGADASVGAGDYIIMYQPLEGVEVQDLEIGTAAAQTISISLWVKSNISGTFGISLINSAGNRSYVATSTTTANTWTRTTINGIVLDTTGTWVTGTGGVGIYLNICLMGGSTYQATAGSWQAGYFLTTSGQTNYAGTNGNTFQITGVKLAKEGTATPLVRLPMSERLTRCQRYYRKSFPQGTAVGQNKGVAGAITTKNPIALGDPSEYVQFSPTMCKSPTITTYNPSVTNANWRDITAAADVTVSVDPGSTKSDSGVLIATSGTVTTLGDILAIHYSADARLA